MRQRLLEWILRTFFKDAMVIWNASVEKNQNFDGYCVRIGQGDVVTGNVFDGRAGCMIKRIGLT